MSSLFIQNLNPSQCEAVLQTEGPLLIFAGAGSGKTRVLVHRIAHLIQEKGVSPWNIFAVTFTNKAAQEMKERISKLLGRRSDDVWISTFHSAGVRILRNYPERIGRSPHFTIFDDSDQLSLMKEGMELLNINPKLFHPRNILSKINQAKNELLNAEEFESTADDFFAEKVAKVYTWYEAELIKNNAVDFGDLILLPVKLFEQNPEILKLYQNRLQYILVDEYQDTNHAQYRLVQLLSQTHQNVCVVGDDDQSIYRWRGANIRNILDFEVDFPSASVIKMEQNYRSTQTIIKAAAQVVSKIEERREKNIWTENEEGEAIVHFTAFNEKGESAFIVKEIRRLIDGQNISLKDCAIFYRTNAQSRTMEDELRKNNIPYKIIGGTRFYDRLEIKDILAYLYVVANPASALHLKRVINVPNRGIGKTSLEKLEIYANQKQILLWDALQNPAEAGLSTKTSNEVKKFIALIERLKTGSTIQKLSEWVRSVIEETGYLAELKLENSLESESRIENLDELITVVHDYENSNSEPTLGGFLDQITLASNVDDLTSEGGVLPLMTLHLAKGLEFDYVFIIGLEEGLFPHSRSFDSPEEMDEERRLMYVGMTRAKNKLYLTHALQRKIYGSEQMNLSSRFLEDIPPEFLDKREEKRIFSSFNRPTFHPSTFDEKEFVQSDDSTNPYRIGRRVKHPTFGMGTIKGCEGTENDRKITILFQNGEMKRLIAKYANLQLI